MVNLWKEKVSGPMHILHLGYGAGSFLVPQIAKPFLSQRVAQTSSAFYIVNCLSDSNSTYDEPKNGTTMQLAPENNHFEYGYFIVMAIILTIASVYCVFFYLSRKKRINVETPEQMHGDRKKTTREIFHFNSCSPGHPYYAAVLFIFIPIWFYIAVGGQMIFANYLYSYCRDNLCLDKDKAANIQSTFWIGFSAGRFAGFVFALWIPMKVLLFLEAGGNLLSALVLLFNPSNTLIVWIFSCVSGFFVGPLYPTGIAWANRYLTMTGVAYTITLIGGSLAGVSLTVAIGWFFEHKGPEAFWYFVIGYSAIACISAVCMHLVARTRGDKYEREERQADSDEINMANRVPEELQDEK